MTALCGAFSQVPRHNSADIPLDHPKQLQPASQPLLALRKIQRWMPTKEPFCICQRQTALVSSVEPGWRPSWGPLIIKKAQPDITVRSMRRNPEKHWGKCGISAANLTVWLKGKVGVA